MGMLIKYCFLFKFPDFVALHPGYGSSTSPLSLEGEG